jgi:hypothetical protein
MAAYYKVEVSLNTNAVEVGVPSPQTVNVVVPTIGPQGEKGDQGDVGNAGPANSLAIGTVSTGAAGSNASATITGAAPNQTLDLSIPRGDKGDTGDTGATGPANSLAIGTVSTGAAGSNAAATITGTAPNQTLGLTIPVGATGATGATGPQGPTIEDANAPATNNILWQIRTSAFTAASGGRYVANGTFAVTNPASGNDGTLFQVVVASGTVTVNGVAYGASRWPVTVARISGAWATLANTLTQNQTLNGTNNVAPNQTAASGSSIMTRDLGDARYGGQNFVAMVSGVTMTQNNTTLEDIAGASLVLPTGTYIITVKMFFIANASAGSKMAMAFDGTSSQRGFRQTITTSVVQAVAIGSFGSTSSATATETEHYRVYECVVTAQGTLKLQGAQNVAGINALTASGFLKAEKIV